MSHSTVEYLMHIKAELDFLSEKSANLTFKSFIVDETLKRAFARSFELIGEASKNIPDEFKLKHTDINMYIAQIYFGK